MTNNTKKGEMLKIVLETLQHLNERHGVPVKQMMKCLKSKYDIDDPNIGVKMKSTIKTGVNSGAIVQEENKYRVSDPLMKALNKFACCRKRRRKSSCPRRRRRKSSCPRRRRRPACPRKRRRRSCPRKRKRRCVKRRPRCPRKRRSCPRRRKSKCPKKTRRCADFTQIERACQNREAPESPAEQKLKSNRRRKTENPTSTPRRRKSSSGSKSGSSRSSQSSKRSVNESNKSKNRLKSQNKDNGHENMNKPQDRDQGPTMEVQEEGMVPKGKEDDTLQ